MEDREIEERIRKLKKRGFFTDGVRESCPACGVSAQAIFKILSRVGGRDIRWCLACGVVRSWRRTADDHLFEEKDFDLDAFLK